MLKQKSEDELNIWLHSKHVVDLYTKRVKKLSPEMTCAKQAAQIISRNLKKNETLLDCGCGTGWFYHSIKKISPSVNYWGFDKTKKFIEIGKKYLPKFGLDPSHLMEGDISYVQGKFDHVLCMNVLSNIENWHKPLDNLVKIAKNSILIRESLSNFNDYKYVEDKYLDDGNLLKVHVNTYKKNDFKKFLFEHGFSVHYIKDIRTNGAPEMVIDYPHYWNFILAIKENK